MADTKFDIISYLGLNLDLSSQEIATKELLDALSKYIIIRIIEIVPEEKLEKLKDEKDLVDIAKNTIPDLNHQVKKFLEDFREAYQKTTGVN